jgi:hypothetical protein
MNTQGIFARGGTFAFTHSQSVQSAEVLTVLRIELAQSELKYLRNSDSFIFYGGQPKFLLL